VIERVDHHAIIVSDIDRSIAFYQDILGFKLHSKRENVIRNGLSRGLGSKEINFNEAILKFGDDTLELIQYNTPKGKAYDKLCSDIGMHLAFLVSDIHKMHDEMVKKGVKFNGPCPKEWAGGFWCYFTDPDGVQLELLEKRAISK